MVRKSAAHQDMAGEQDVVSVIFAVLVAPWELAALEECVATGGAVFLDGRLLE